MKNDAAMAFLIMTGEERVVGGGWRARQNVVHEVGYFQAALGPTRAIILLEEGCEKFSNASGIVHISFAQGKVSDAFHKIRQTLTREKLLPP